MSAAKENQVSESEQEDRKNIKSLEEDDEFEDFPEDVTQWSNDSKIKEEILWEQDWDDDDNQDQFSQKLKEELLRSQKPAQSK
ncbi:hypothetical protein KGF56_001348 [Candida oxycetoniae]|uniref:26S proteasome complex subunit SEM1 n=1 Tax=Candida oxycetoniae TaxID=497107 RepID=A0AAI9WYV2_9ASCO|nr:uncharacterized protein KGF56_001348 [Candida oxycetoniae]KAI3405741.1 hypothetical protein KGF56_001348 [Candida oxycetoniae]